MSSHNSFCSWQFILFVALLLLTDFTLAKVESFNEQTFPTPPLTVASNYMTKKMLSETNKHFVEPKTMDAVTKSRLEMPTNVLTTTEESTELDPTIKTPNVGTNTISIAASSETGPSHSVETETRMYETTRRSSSITTADEFPLKIPTTATIKLTTTIGTRTTLSADYYYDYASTTRMRAMPTTTPNNDVTLMHPPSADVLTKGFTIPTFLPPVREFAVADLPSYLTTTTTTSATMTTTLDNGDDQFYFSANGRRTNLTSQSSNVSVQLGNHAYMPCNIHQHLNKPVSWVRLRDGHILSVDQTTFIADQRFQSIYNEENEPSWSLQIKYVQESDEGWYECQLSTEPKLSSKIYLEVVVPLTELIGDQNRFVKAGSKVALHCIVRGTIVPPTYIIWFREKAQISDDNEMGWYTQIDRNIFGNASDNQNTIGSLIIPFVRKRDTGNFTCQPANSVSVSVHLHVLSGEYSASAIMSAARIYTLDSIILLFIFLLLALPKT